MTDIIFGKEYIVKVTDDGECVTIGELIRCKDCKYYEPARADDEADTCGMLYWMMDVPLWVKAEDYCSFAERKE